MHDVVFPLWIIGIPSIKARQHTLAMQSTLKLAMIDSVCLSVTIRLDQTQDGLTENAGRENDGPKMTTGCEMAAEKKYSFNRDSTTMNRANF